ncbi:MAG: precorrin-6A/cobalt-precorrin-6A reductase [Cyanobium sp.]
MQGPAVHQTPLPHDDRGHWIWLIAGTGEGPPLAARLLERGWAVRVSVVSAAAGLAYPAHPRLMVAVGAIGYGNGNRNAGADGGESAAAVLTELRSAAAAGQPCRWVIDASHPFALRISAGVAEACRLQGQTVLRLQRPHPAGDAARILADLPALAQEPLAGRRLLLAIGARRLAEAIDHCPGAVAHARLLPSPAALRQAMAAGLPAERVACLRPQADAAAAATIEAALCRRWRIEVVLCRRSGGPSESHWRRICHDQGLRLLLLERPPEIAEVPALPLEALLAHIGDPPPPAGPGAMPTSRSAALPAPCHG